MKTISFWLLIFTFTAALARGQDTATQQQIDQLNGRLQDLIDAQNSQGKRIAALEKQIADLGDKMNQPAANDYASRDDLKKLAEQVQEIDKKRQDDNDQVIKQIQKLGSIGGGSGHKSPTVSKPVDESSNSGAPTSGPATPQKGYDYTIASGDTVGAIAKAYRAKGVKVTTDQILKANPGLNPNSLIIGKRIFIPDPNAK